MTTTVMPEFRKEEYQKAADALRNFVSSSGGRDLTELLTVENISKTLLDAKCDEVVRMQICIFLKEGSVTRYLSQSAPGVWSVGFNNIVMSAAERSGLDQRTIIELLNIILYAISVNEEQRFSAKISSGKMLSIWAVTKKREKKRIQDIRLALDKYAEQRDGEVNISNYLADLDRLADSGIPEALYLKGKCYFEGIGTAKNPVVGYQYLAAACRGGSAEANAMLGDYYYYPSDTHFSDPTEAFERYTALGAVALSEQRQNNLKALIEERKLNYKLIVVNFIIYLSTIILNTFIAQGIFSGGQSHWVLGIISYILLTGVFSLSVLQMVRKPYGDQHWAVPIFAVISLLLMLLTL